MASAEIVEESNKGVRTVRTEFMVREDEALAQRLQDQEYEYHYNRNREERGTARIDVKAAKETYLQEIKNAGVLQRQELERLAEDDVWVAAELQQRVIEEEDLEAQRKAAVEMQDEEYAKYLHEREQEKIEQARQRRLQKRIERERQEMQRIQGDIESGRAQEGQMESSGAVAGPSSARMVNGLTEDVRDLRVDVESRSSASVAAARTQHNRIELRHADTDTDEEPKELRQLRQAQNDEEYARRLQQREEEKQRRYLEERDRRLALKLQKRETEEYRRRKADKEMRRAQSLQEPRGEDNHITDRSLETEESAPRIGIDKRRAGSLPAHSEQRVPLERDLPVQSSSTGERVHPSSSRRPFQVEEVTEASNETNESTRQKELAPERRRNSKTERGRGAERGRDSARQSERDPDEESRNTRNQESEEFQSQKQFYNIAETIDPTYSRKQQDGADIRDTSYPRPDEIETDPISSSRPVPVIQNMKRTKSSGSKRKGSGSEKCKQQ